MVLTLYRSASLINAAYIYRYSDLLVSDALAFELMRRPPEELSIRVIIVILSSIVL